MGAVFTLGGLVIALMSVLTYFTLNERASKAVETKIEELLPEFGRHIDGWFYLKTAESLAKSSAGQDWRGIKRNVELALKKDPGLDTAGYGLLGEVAAEHMLSGKLESWQIAKPYHGGPDPAVTIIEVTIWLERAGNEKAAGEGRPLMFRALISALDGRYDDMIKEVEGLKDFPDRLSELRKPRYLCLLAYACADRNSPRRHQVSSEQLNKLGEVLSVPDNRLTLPATEKELVEDLSNKDRYQLSREKELPGWCVMPRPTAEPKDLRGYTHPNRLLITRCNKGQEDSLRYSYQLEVSATIQCVPLKEPLPLPLDLGDHEQQCSRPLEELAKKLFEKFYFICYLPAKDDMGLNWGRYRPENSWLRSQDIR